MVRQLRLHDLAHEQLVALIGGTFVPPPRAGNLKLALDQHLVLQIADLDPRKQLGAESIRELRGRPFVRRAFALGSHRLALRGPERRT